MQKRSEKALILKAKNFAIRRHTEVNQRYGDRPYNYHLGQVVAELVFFGFTEELDIIAAAWLHDTLEDTCTTRDELIEVFGESISNIVWAVTGEGSTRRERLMDAAAKIQSNPSALPVKLADRLANTKSSLEQSTKGVTRYFKMYSQEFPLFKSLLYNSLSDNRIEEMWKALELIS